MATANFYVLAKALQSDQGLKEQRQVATEQVTARNGGLSTVRKLCLLMDRSTTARPQRSGSPGQVTRKSSYKSDSGAFSFG
jgi:hypothetical protein